MNAVRVGAPHTSNLDGLLLFHPPQGGSPS